MRQNSKTNQTIRKSVLAVDFIIFNVLFFIFVDLDWVRPWIYNNSPAMLQLGGNLAFVVAQYFFSTVVHRPRTTGDQILRQVTLLSIVYMFVSYLLIRFISHYEGTVSPSVNFTLWFSLVLYVLILFSRYIERWCLSRYRSSGHNMRHVVFVGSDKVLLPIYEFFNSDSSMGYAVTGYYSDNELENCPEGLKRKGTLADLDKVMESQLDAGTTDEVYCCLPENDMERVRKLLRYCSNNVVHFYYVPTFSKIFGHVFKQEQVGETTVFTKYGEPLMNPTNKAIKRTFDIVMSSFVLLFLVVLIPIVAIIIKVQSPGPIFFKQARTGLNGYEFYCYKFRSMHVNKDADLIQATEHDPRKFAFGNFMRKANIDELPQFWNVFKGDMSIVGPRPHMLHHTEIYRELIDKYMVRHFVKPGITGWAQVTGFRGETKELWQMEGRVKRDIWYIENWSIWLDLRIIWKTAKQIVVHDKNAY